MSTQNPKRHRARPSDNPIPDDVQRVFDTVTGLNLRLSDNLLQLLVIVCGTILSAIIGLIWAIVIQSHPMVGILLGGFIGVVVSLLLSGAILGMIRFFTAVRRR